VVVQEVELFMQEVVEEQEVLENIELHFLVVMQFPL